LASRRFARVPEADTAVLRLLIATTTPADCSEDTYRITAF